MNSFASSFLRSAKLVALSVFAVLCVAALDTQAATLAAANPTSISPASAAVHPSAQMHPPADQDIRDIRPPYHIAPGWLWLAWTGGCLAAIALGYGVWRWRRKGIRGKLPYELALEQLEAARRLMHPEQARAFSIVVSEVVRDYIERCFPVRASHFTTNEFLHDLATKLDSPLVSHQSALTDFLEYCDLAKFARWNLSVPQMESMLQSAEAFVVATSKPNAQASAKIACAADGDSALNETATISKPLNPQMS